MEDAGGGEEYRGTLGREGMGGGESERDRDRDRHDGGWVGGGG